jgi:hypothetical protein
VSSALGAPILLDFSLAGVRFEVQVDVVVSSNFLARDILERASGGLSRRLANLCVT